MKCLCTEVRHSHFFEFTERKEYRYKQAEYSTIKRRMPQLLLKNYGKIFEIVDDGGRVLLAMKQGDKLVHRVFSNINRDHSRIEFNCER